MSLEFHKEFESIDGSPYTVHIKSPHTQDGHLQKTYCVERWIYSYKGNWWRSIYIKENEDESFVIIKARSFQKFYALKSDGLNKDAVSNQEIAACKNPILYEYQKGAESKYLVVFLAHKAMLDLPEIVEWEHQM